MLSDPTASVSIFALDVDPCTGEETERLIGNAIPKAGDPRNKFTWRADSTTLGHYVREYRIKANSGQKTTSNGIVAGQYVQPVTEWIMPEANVPGVNLPALSFGQFDHLTKGFGPYLEDDGDLTLFGPLDPYPGPTQPPNPVCSVVPPPTATPTVNAGADQTLIAGALVTLSGSNTNTALVDGNLNFEWTQTGGTPLGTGVNKLTNPTAKTATFIAPQQTVTYTFQLKACVKDASGASTTKCATASTKIVIQTRASNPNIKDIVTVDTFSWQSQQGGTLSVACHSNVVDGTVTSMRLTANTLTGGTAAMSAVGSTPGAFTFQSRSVKLPGAVTCTSNIGGSGSRTTTTQ
jgi:hypothetical protein